MSDELNAKRDLERGQIIHTLAVLDTKMDGVIDRLDKQNSRIDKLEECEDKHQRFHGKLIGGYVVVMAVVLPILGFLFWQMFHHVMGPV